MHVLVGVTGGIAAYKALPLIREFKRLGHEVRVVASQSAFRFVGKDSLAALSENPVESELFEDSDQVRHIALAKWAELLVVAPATAAFLSRFAAGSAWDLLDNVSLAATCPVIVAPAMHTEMWQHPATVANVATLRARGVLIVEPAAGWLSSGDFGSGRLPEPQQIAEAALRQAGPRDLLGVNAVVTAGGTREPIDPVRYLGNRSTGKTGIAIARELWRRGANVTLIGCNLDGQPSVDFACIEVKTVGELKRELQSVSPDVLVMAAAVSDFTVQASATKLVRGVNAQAITLIPTEDLLAGFAASKPSTFCVGFTLQDRKSLRESAVRKLAGKGVSLMVANELGALEGDSTRGFILAANGEIPFDCTKDSLAALVVDQVAERIAVGGRA